MEAEQVSRDRAPLPGVRKPRAVSVDGCIPWIISMVSGRFLGTRDRVTDSELRKLPGGVLFEPDSLVDGNDGGIPNKGEKKEFWNILNSGQTNRHQT